MINLNKSRFTCWLLIIAAAAIAAPAALAAQSTESSVAAAARSEGQFEWVTLGTQGGPMPAPQRGQPANLLVREGEAYLVDAGDGAISQFIGSGGRFPWLRGVFISHLHFDHIGGLFALIGLRAQTHTSTPLTIYGPPGTATLVAGLVAATRPSTEAGYGVEGETEFPADQGLTVIELTDGANIDVGEMTVRAVNNTHYTFAAGSDLAARYQSLSFRFDFPDRSIVYTGDTGPSQALEQLAQGADLLVTEMIDPDFTSRNIARRSAEIDPAAREDMLSHLSRHHLSTRQIGEMAMRAGIGRVVITHLAGGAEPDAAQRYIAEVNAVFPGPVVVADDLDRF